MRNRGEGRVNGGSTMVIARCGEGTESDAAISESQRDRFAQAAARDGKHKVSSAYAKVLRSASDFHLPCSLFRINDQD